MIVLTTGEIAVLSTVLDLVMVLDQRPADPAAAAAYDNLSSLCRKVVRFERLVAEMTPVSKEPA